VRRYVLDTNVWIAATRDVAAAAALAEWLRMMGPTVYQHSVVAAELLVGARDEVTWRRWHDRWVLPSERVRRVIVPSAGAWLAASRVVSRLCQRGLLTGPVGRGFLNDCLLACSARERGFTVITNNLEDFRLIAEVERAAMPMAPLP